MHNRYRSIPTAGLVATLNFDLSPVQNGKNLCVEVFAKGAGNVSSVTSGWTLVGTEYVSASDINHRLLVYRKDAVVNNDASFSITFDSAVGALGFVHETNVALSDTFLLKAGYTLTQMHFNPDPFTSDVLAWFTMYSTDPTFEFAYDQFTIHAANSGHIAEVTTTGDSIGPAAFSIYSQFADGQDIAGNIYVNDGPSGQEPVELAGVMLLFEGETALPVVDKVNGVDESAAEIVKGEVVTVAFDGNLPDNITLRNASFGDIAISVSKSSSNTAQFTISDNALPDQDLNLVFSSSSEDFASITVPFVLPEGWFYGILPGVAPDIDDEVEAGDYVGWNDPDYELAGDGSNVVPKDEGDFELVEVIQIFTINVSGNASHSDTEIRTYRSSGNNLPELVSQIPNIVLSVGDEIFYDISQHVTDQDGDTLSFSSPGLLQAGISIVRNDNDGKYYLLASSVSEFEGQNVPIEVFDGADSITIFVYVEVVDGAVPNPVYDIKIYLWDAVNKIEYVAPENKAIFALVYAGSSITDILVALDSYNTDSEGKIRIDDDALQLGVENDVYLRDAAQEKFGLRLRNVLPKDANA